MTKLVAKDTMMDVMMKMSEGNPGGLKVCMDILEKGEIIDPEVTLGGLGLILMLDSYEIYGSEIWMLYKDVCDESIGRTIAVIRACQLGFINTQDLHYAIHNRGKGIDVDECVANVAGRLSAFNVDACE